MSLPFSMMLVVDAETRWSSKATAWSEEPYTLSKMTTEAYIRSPLFKAFGFCIHEYGTNKPTQWYSHKELPRIFSTYDWSKTAVIAHNAAFDVGIMSMVYGVKPAFIFDSLSMARALRGVEVGNSLMKLADAFGLPPKGRAVHSTDGLEELTPEIERELAEYCKHDVYLCEQIFSKLLIGLDPESGELRGKYPVKELKLIDMTLKMFTNPELRLDTSLLEDAHHDEQQKLIGALERAGVAEADLASADKFSDILRQRGVEPPTKKSPATGLQIPALAKNDAMFQALLNGDDEDVALLCEARLRVKSTLERTRSQRFIDIASRGALPVPLKYYGAETGRYSAWDSINLQNMKRGSFLRKSIMAPEGKVLVVGDLSQIEPRVLAWLSDYEEMLDIFRSGVDAYAVFGAQMFNVPGMTKDSHPLLRQSAKSALLGCFGSQTPVLTKRGWVSIVDVTTEDLLWDGVEWVAHQGPVAQGEKEVLTRYGVSATSDHEILTGHGWVAWSAVLSSPSLFQSAMSLASLPACGGTPAPSTKYQEATQCSRGCAALAAGRGMSPATICGAGAQQGAIPVLKRNPFKRVWPLRAWRRYAPTGLYETACWIASAPSLFAATTPTALRTQTTEGGVFTCTPSGAQTEGPFCSTSSRLTATISSICSSIAETITGGMSRATCALSHVAKTWRTSGKSQPVKSTRCDSASSPLKQRMQTYDIALAGPRNRYTILTDEGPIIVHNCGYQLGWASFAAQLLVGFLGAPPVRYTKEQARQLGVTQADVQAFIDNKDYVAKMQKITYPCTQQELLIHCLAAKAIVDKYRRTAAPVKSFWEMLDSLIRSALIGGREYTHKCLTFRKEEIVLPSGMSLKYPNLRVREETNPDTGKKETQYVYGVEGGKTKKLYAGRICNNVTQGVARVVMTDGLLRIAPLYPVKGSVHDEGIFLAPEDEAEKAQQFVYDEMTRIPKWMPGIPLDADVHYGKRYGDIK